MFLQNSERMYFERQMRRLEEVIRIRNDRIATLEAKLQVTQVRSREREREEGGRR